MDSDPSQPFGAWSAFGAYAALLFGMLVIGAPAQQHGIVLGLWLTEALAIALPAAFALSVAGVRFAPYLGLRRLSWQKGLVATAVAAANQPIVSFLTWAERLALPAGWVADFDAKQRMLDAVFAAHAVPMTITVVLAAPLGEELFFRGFAFPALRRSWGVVAGVLVSGALFSILHMDPVGFLGLMEIGVLLAALRWWTGSLWAAIIGHAINNGIAGGAFLLGWEDPDLPPPAWVLVLGAVLLVAGVVALVRVLRKPSPAEAAVEPRAPNWTAAGALALVWIASVVVGLGSFRR
ncbi:MAG: CPBP family intramembrane glutamic endopeptidase [Myxococcales bacterium]